MPLLSITKLDKFAGTGDSRIHILKNISLEVERGEFIAVIGPSGSGKSTLMNILGCLDTPTFGSYMIDGVETRDMGGDRLAALRSNRFGFIFQRYNLINSLSAVENVALPAVYALQSSLERLEQATKLLTALDLKDKLQRRPNELSGGQQQRVSIARALMNGGEIILADEPTGALDSESGEAVINILKELNSKGHTVIVVTHNQEVAAHADRIIEIRDGIIVTDKRVKERLAPTISLAFVSHNFNFLAFIKKQLSESFKMAIQSIGAHKLRSILTMLGIIIGIASVVSVISLGRGSQEKILSDIKTMGTNTIEIFPGEGFGDMQAWRVTTLTPHDAEILAEQSYLAGVTPNINAMGVIGYNNISLNGVITGVSAQYFAIKGLRLQFGRFFLPNDIRNNSSVVIIDSKSKDALFPGGENPIGKIIICNRQPLEIVGVTQAQNIAIASSENPTFWIPYTTAMYKISGVREISSITVRVHDDVDSQVAEKSLTSLLTLRHGGKKDFFTFNMDNIKRTAESATDTLRLLVSGIALISLVVGGIGVMNIMLVSVTERTAEIGLRMAIGARRHNILTQFLIESILLCIIGGFAGILLSFLLLEVFNFFTTSFRVSYSIGSIIIALCCSSFIGVLFGFIPARKASRLNPIDALARD